MANITAEFPLIQLPRKSEAKKLLVGYLALSEVSINSTSEEVRSDIVTNILRNQNVGFH